MKTAPLSREKVLRLPWKPKFAQSRLLRKSDTQIETRLESIAPATKNAISNRNACHKTQQKHAICDEIDLRHMILWQFVSAAQRWGLATSQNGRVRTVADTKTTLSEHDSDLQTSSIKREPFATHSGKTWVRVMRRANNIKQYTFTWLVYEHINMWVIRMDTPKTGGTICWDCDGRIWKCQSIAKLKSSIEQSPTLISFPSSSPWIKHSEIAPVAKAYPPKDCFGFHAMGLHFSSANLPG